MTVRIGGAGDIAPGTMHVFTISGTKVGVANANGHLCAFVRSWAVHAKGGDLLAEA